MAVLLFVGGISGAVRDAALADADRADSRDDEVRSLNAARGADKAMWAGIWTGSAMVVVGLPLTIAGAVLKHQARTGYAKRFDIDGSGLSVRF
jgi:hypothetical protein